MADAAMVDVRHGRFGRRTGLLATLAGVTGLILASVLPAGSATAATATSTFDCDYSSGACLVTGAPGEEQVVAVPRGTTRMTVVLVGGRGAPSSDGIPGGQGGMTVVTFPVNEGDLLGIELGGGGSGATPGTGFSDGGRGGGGDTVVDGTPTGGAGGGSSALYDAGSSDLIAVAGGGGGGGGSSLGLSDAGGAGGAGGNPAKDGYTAEASDGPDGAAGGGAGGSSSNDGQERSALGPLPTSGGGGGGYASDGRGGGGSGSVGAPDGDEEYPAAGGGAGGASYASSVATTAAFTSSGPWNDSGDGVAIVIPNSEATVFGCHGSTQDLDIPEGGTGAFAIAGGASGESTRDGGDGGSGAVVTGRFDAAAGTQLQIVTGCGGANGGYGWASGGRGGERGTASDDGGTGGGSTAVLITGEGEPRVGAGGGGGAGGPIFDGVCTCPGGDGGDAIDTLVPGGVGTAGAGGDGGGARGGNGGPGGFADGAGGDSGENHRDGAAGGGGGGGILNGGSFGRAGGFSSAGGGGGAGSSNVDSATTLVSAGNLDPRYDTDGLAIVIPVFGIADDLEEPSTPVQPGSPGDGDPASSGDSDGTARLADSGGESAALLGIAAAATLIAAGIGIRMRRRGAASS